MPAHRALAILLTTAICSPAQNAAEMVQRALAGFTAPGMIRSAFGITRHDTAIPCLISPDDLDYETPKTRLLLVGGADGSPAAVESVLRSLQWFREEGGSLTRQFSVSAVPILNPEGWAWGTGASNRSGGSPARGYPPAGKAYGSPTDPEAAYLWRWIGLHAPDLVIEVRSDGPLGWHVPDENFLPALRPRRLIRESDDLVTALTRGAPAGMGAVPAVRFQVGASYQVEFLRELLMALRKAKFTGPSPARREAQARLRRTPAEIAGQLSRRYGRSLEDVVYVGSFSLVGRLRLGHVADVERIVQPWFTGAKPALARPTGSHLAGHLVFAELARVTGKPRYTELARAAADLNVEALHDEMSDAMFMGCPILAQVGRLTGETRYFDRCARHMQFIASLTRRGDNLYRHSPLDSAAWGRGNGFVAAGLALSLSDLPKEHPGRAEMLRVFQAGMEAWARYQDPTGAWHQVIDHPGSYREFTATCLIGFAARRGVREGWLDAAKFDPVARRAWSAVKARIAPDGTLVDVCEGTGKQRSLRAYLDRAAILGEDPRGGAMALLIATEMARD